MYDETTYYALANGFSLWYERSGEVRVVEKCGQRPPRVSDPEKGKQRKQTKYPCASSDDLPKCPWRCYDRWMVDEKTFQCISLNDEHTCNRNFNFRALVNYKWIAKIFDDKIRANPYIKLCDIVDLGIGEHYSMLKAYGKAILDSNPGSTVKLGVIVNPDGKTNFDRFYVCFAGLADGWKAGCRKIIALDGCFLQSPNQGEILTAIRRDGNNHIYLVAWVVVNVENKDNWTWFLELLEEDLGCSRGNGLTLMSDRHKGLIEAVKDAASKASYPQLFNKIMDKIKSANPNTHKYLMDKNPKNLVKSLFETQHEPEQTQVENQVEQTEDQAKIDPTQLEKTQEPTQDQVHPQEQPQQAALRMTSARILQRKLGKQGSSQNTSLNLD
ncbi:multidrug resistance-associated protein 5 [Tanacetum coccineum]